MKELVSIAAQVAAKLIERRQTISVAEFSAGGLISAALLAVPGASAYFIGSAVVYTRDARRILMDIPDDAMKGNSFVIRAVCQAAGKPDPDPVLHRLGPLGDRRGGADRQPLRRRRRSQLRQCRRSGAGRDHDRDRQRRPARQHEQFCQRRLLNLLLQNLSR